MKSTSSQWPSKDQFWTNLVDMTIKLNPPDKKEERKTEHKAKSKTPSHNEPVNQNPKAYEQMKKSNTKKDNQLNK